VPSADHARESPPVAVKTGSLKVSKTSSFIGLPLKPAPPSHHDGYAFRERARSVRVPTSMAELLFTVDSVAC
jgi:hypothetical protein